MAVTQYFRMHELVNYISYITHKILSAINSKILSLSAIKNIGPIMQTLLSILLTVKATWKYLLKKVVLISFLHNVHCT